MPIIFIFIPLSDTKLMNSSWIAPNHAFILDSVIYTRFKETIGDIVSSITFLEVLDCLKWFKT